MANEKTLSNIRIQQRRDTAANWATSTLILLAGEMAVETDTGRFKFGDGTHKFSEIPKYAGVLVEYRDSEGNPLTNGHLLIDGQDVTVYSLPTATSTEIGGIKAADTVEGGGYATGAVQIDSATGLGTVAHVIDADKLTNAFNLTAAGDATGTVGIDGSSDVTFTLTFNTMTTAGTYTKVNVNSKGQVIGGEEKINLTDINNIGTVASLNGGTAEGNVPVLGVGGKLDTNVLPALAIGDTATVADDTERFALTKTDVQNGDIVIVTGTNKTYRVIDDTKLGNENGYALILTPANVVSVNGKTGIVTLASTDLSDSDTVLHVADAIIFDGGSSTANV